jgi:predicted metal-dependent phosphoesterase TrpH
MKMLIDLHTHTRGSDGRSSADEIVERAIAAGLDGIAITDHHKVSTKEGDKVAELARKCGLRVFRGVEYSSADGHMLLFGVTDELVKTFGRYGEAQPVIDAVNKAGGAVVVSHPFRGYKRAFYEKVTTLKGLAGWEGYNGQASYQAPTANDEAMRMARRLGRRTTGGSDAHEARDIGLTYTFFPGSFDSDAGLVRALKRGGYVAKIDRKRVEAYRIWRAETLRQLSLLDKKPVSALPVGSAASDPHGSAAYRPDPRPVSNSDRLLGWSNADWASPVDETEYAKLTH